MRMTQRSAAHYFMPVHKAQPLHLIAPLLQLFSFPPTLRAVICFLNQPLPPTLPLFWLDFFFLKKEGEK